MHRFQHIAVLTLLLALAGCASNPFKTAQTVEQQADAAYGVFTIAQEAAVQIKRDPVTPQEVKDALAEADRVTKPLADGLFDLVIEFQAVKAAYEVAESAEDKEAAQVALAAAEAKLNAYLKEVIDDINRYSATVAGVKRRQPVSHLPQPGLGLMVAA